MMQSISKVGICFNPIPASEMAILWLYTLGAHFPYTGDKRLSLASLDHVLLEFQSVKVKLTSSSIKDTRDVFFFILLVYSLCLF